MQSGGDPDLQWQGACLHTVFHGVLDERLNKEAEHGILFRSRLNVEYHFELLLIPFLFNREIVADSLQLVLYRDVRAISADERIPQELGKLRDQRARLLRIFINQCSQGIEGIEKEMGIELISQRVELDLLGFSLCILCALPFVDPITPKFDAEVQRAPHKLLGIDERDGLGSSSDLKQSFKSDWSSVRVGDKDECPVPDRGHQKCTHDNSYNDGWQRNRLVGDPSEVFAQEEGEKETGEDLKQEISDENPAEPIRRCVHDNMSKSEDRPSDGLIMPEGPIAKTSKSDSHGTYAFSSL